jgi:ligand-binding SRPBCC domain-containing protein
LAEFSKSVIIDAPVERVFAFHERDDALDLLSPSFPPVRVLRRTGGIAAGARVEVRLGFLKWTALHTAYEKNRLFVDEQVEGPFRSWVHRHEFEDVGGKTRLTDRVRYQLRGGALAHAVLGVFVRLALRSLFRHRHQLTRRFCEREITPQPPSTFRGGRE